MTARARSALATLFHNVGGQPSGVTSREAGTLVPPDSAPAKWRHAVDRVLEHHPFETNVFCMTRFPGRTPPPDDPIAGVITTVRATLADHGLTMHLASDRTADDDLLANVMAHAWACRFGIALLESRVGSGLNANLLVELGSMVGTGRRCALLKDGDAPELPTDFSGYIYKQTDFSDLAQVQAIVTAWVTADLGFHRAAGRVRAATGLAR